MTRLCPICGARLLLVNGDWCCVRAHDHCLSTLARCEGSRQDHGRAPDRPRPARALRSRRAGRARAARSTNQGTTR